MTLTAMARQLNTSPMTVYRRLKRAGVNIEELRDAGSGQLTAAGVSTIAALFDTTTPQTAITGDATQIQHDDKRDATGVTQDAATAAAVLQAKLDGANAIIEQLTSERDELRRQLDAVTAALHAEQADRANERRLLTAGEAGDGQQRRGIFRWFSKK